jgi:hypothetical protein
MTTDGSKVIDQLAKYLSKATLTDKEFAEKERTKYFEKVNFQESKQTLDELEVPKELRYHIPRESAQFQRLSEEARKTRRKNFNIQKSFPAAANFRTNNKNKKLDTALKTLATHFQSNVKYNLGGTIETASLLAKTGSRLKRLIHEHKLLSQFLLQAHQNGVDLNNEQNFSHIYTRISEEFGLYEETLAELKVIFDRLTDLVFLQNDAAADGIEQIKNICLAIKHLKPKKNTLPTREDYKDAVGGAYRFGGGRRGGYGRGGYGRGRGGRHRGGGRYGSPYKPSYPKPYQYNNTYNNNQQQNAQPRY